MFKKTIYGIWFLLLALGLIADQGASGDIKAEAETQYQLAIETIGKGDNQQALKHARKANTLYAQLEDDMGLAQSWGTIGEALYQLGRLAESLEAHQTAFDKYQQLNHDKGSTVSLNCIGNVYLSFSDYQKALSYYRRAMEIYRKKPDSNLYAILLNNMGHIYKETQSYDKALEYFSQSLAIREKNGEKIPILASRMNIGNTYKEMKQYEDALRILEEALAGVIHLKYKRGIAYCHAYIGDVHRLRNDGPSSLKSYLNALQLQREIDNQTGIAECSIKLGILYKELGQFSKAIHYLNQGLNISKDIKSKNFIQQVYENLSQIHENTGNLKKALETYKLFRQTEKEIFNQESDRQLTFMKTRFETEMKEQEIKELRRDRELLESRNRIHELTIKSQRILRNGLAIILVLVLIIMGFLIKKYLYLFAFWKKAKYVGHYRLMEKVGTGGMGTVYKVHDIRNKSQTAAIKILKEDFLMDETIRKRFDYEAEIIDQLDHPNIIKVIERGQFKKTHYIVMEYLQGQTLDSLIETTDLLSLKECLNIMLQITDAIRLVHSKSIIHRDIKPSNIMMIQHLKNPFFVKLMDFGLAKTKYQTKLTETGKVVGTINYMAPEQITQSISQKSSDIYSLGVTFYELLTGQKPFIGSSPTAIMHAILQEEPISPIKLRKDTPKKLNNLIVKMMEKDMEKRPSAVEVYRTLTQNRS